MKHYVEFAIGAPMPGEIVVIETAGPFTEAEAKATYERLTKTAGISRLCIVHR